MATNNFQPNSPLDPIEVDGRFYDPITGTDVTDQVLNGLPEDDSDAENIGDYLDDDEDYDREENSQDSEEKESGDDDKEEPGQDQGKESGETNQQEPGEGGDGAGTESAPEGAVEAGTEAETEAATEAMTAASEAAEKAAAEAITRAVENEVVEGTSAAAAPEILPIVAAVVVAIVIVVVCAMAFLGFGDDTASGLTPGGANVRDGDRDTLAAEVLNHPNITFQSNEARDIDPAQCYTAPLPDSRMERCVQKPVLQFLLALADSGQTVEVSTLIRDHNYMTASGNVSRHSQGLAVDIGNDEAFLEMMK
jgi:hypothetical protein